MVNATIDEEYPQAPPAIRSVLQGKKMMEIGAGYSNTQVYKVYDAKLCLYLKTQAASAFFSFRREILILNWLNQKLPVPEVVEYTSDSSHEYLILTAIPGENCVEAMKTHDHERLVYLLAAGLRKIHSIDISSCPFDERVAEKIKNARYNVDHHLVDEENFDKERQGMTAREVYQAVTRAAPPLEDDLVFTHGDYCLPNVLVHNDAVSGFIDLGRAGISDRYNDLAIASRSIRYNLGAEYERPFFKFYGMETVDKEKIAYYRMMDELF